jgi:hypothetical protein
MVCGVLFQSIEGGSDKKLCKIVGTISMDLYDRFNGHGG